MNKERRAALSLLIDRIEAITLAVTPLLEEIEAIGTDLESIVGAEQEALDNSPESIQNGERGQDMQAAIDNLNAAMEQIEDLAHGLNGWAGADVVSNIDDARGQ